MHRPPLLVVHGSGGGYDHGMAFAGALAQQCICVVAMSRFGYLSTPMPADASQADRVACTIQDIRRATGRPAALAGGCNAGTPIEAGNGDAGCSVTFRSVLR